MHSIHLKVDEVASEVGKMALATDDAARHVEKFSGALPELSDHITSLHRDVAILVERSVSRTRIWNELRGTYIISPSHKAL